MSNFYVEVPEKSMEQSHLNQDNVKSKSPTREASPQKTILEQSKIGKSLGYSTIAKPMALDMDIAEIIDENGQIQQKKCEDRSQIQDRMEKNKDLPAEPPKKEKVNVHLRAEKDVEVEHKAEVKSDHPDMTEVKAKNVHFYELFKEGDTCTKAMAITAIFLSLAGGLLQGMMPVILGKGAEKLGTKTGQTRVDAASDIAYACIAIGIVAIIITTICKICWSYVVQNLEVKIRKSYFRAILNQECAWFDILSPDKITQMYNIDGNNYIRGIGAANQMLLFSVGQAITGLILAFRTAVIYTMICLSLVPIMIVGLAGFLFAITMSITLSKKSYIHAGSLSEQAISGIRTVKSLCGEERELELYGNAIKTAKDILVKYGFIKGMGFGTLFLCMYLNYGIGLWSGGTLVKDQRQNPNTGDPMTTGDVITTFFAC